MCPSVTLSLLDDPKDSICKLGMVLGCLLRKEPTISVLKPIIFI